MSIQSEVELLIEPLKHTDPRTWQALQSLNDQLQLILVDLEPLIRQSQLPGGGIVAIEAPTNFTVASAGQTLRFNWSASDGATQYEVRMGTDWETGYFQFRTSNLTADIDPLLYGSYTFLIKAMNVSGSYSIMDTSVVFSVPQIGPPTVASSVIDNNVLLVWTPPPSTFDIDHYIVKKGSTTVGIATGTFITFFETVSGTYTYSITAVDVAGNTSDTAVIQIQVNQPPDFALQDRRTSALNGTRVNTYKITGPKLLCSYAPETWQFHFVSRTWDQPSDQVGAGYPVYIQPTTNGSYEEVIDYGVVISNVIANVTYNTTQLTPSGVSVVVRMATSLNGSSYSAFTDGASQFFSQFRYLKLHIDFLGDDDKALIEFYNLVISLDVKRENDGGEVNALATDAMGTTVYFTKPFKDIESITTTVKSTTEPFTAIFVFNDVPSPTSFQVYAFDSSGNRVTKMVDWKARGIV